MKNYHPGSNFVTLIRKIITITALWRHPEDGAAIIASHAYRNGLVHYTAVVCVYILDLRRRRENTSLIFFFVFLAQFVKQKRLKYYANVGLESRQTLLFSPRQAAMTTDEEKQLSPPPTRQISHRKYTYSQILIHRYT